MTQCTALVCNHRGFSLDLTESLDYYLAMTLGLGSAAFHDLECTVPVLRHTDRLDVRDLAVDT